MLTNPSHNCRTMSDSRKDSSPRLRPPSSDVFSAHHTCRLPDCYFVLRCEVMSELVKPLINVSWAAFLLIGVCLPWLALAFVFSWSQVVFLLVDEKRSDPRAR